MADPTLIGQLNQIKGLILQVKKGTDTLTENLPTVDFCCDMFDRSDRPILDGYWDSNRVSWTLRDGLIVQQSPVDNDIETYSDVVSSASGTGSGYVMGTHDRYSESNEEDSQVYAPSSNVPSISNSSGLIYSALFSAQDVLVRVGFKISPEYGDTGNDVVVSSQTIINGDLTSAILNRVFTSVAQPFGICFSDDSSRKYGLTGWAASTPNLSVNSAAASLSMDHSFSGSISDGYSVPGGSVDSGWAIFASISDLSATSIELYNTTIDTATINYSSGSQSGPGGFLIWSFSGSVRTEISQVSAPHNLQTGTNVLECSAVGDEYRFSINGLQYPTQTTTIMQGRDRVGIFYLMMNQLSPIVANGVGISGITSFKAWRVDKPEPPDETGHGVYVDDAIKYTDKYHDSNGNYNPEA